MHDIESEALKCLNDGCRELWITSQDNAAYMLDNGFITKLPELIKNICSIDKQFFIRIGMMNPKHLLDALGGMIDVYKMDNGFITKLPELIKNICSIDKQFFIRIGMMNPKHLLDALGGMIDVY